MLFGYPSAYERRLRRLSRFAGLLLSPLLHQSTERPSPWETAREEFDPQAHRALHPFDSSRLVMRSIFASLITAALGDRVEMANSLEGRVPFLDRHVVELAYSLPEHYCVSDEQRKVVVRRAFADTLPPHFAPLPKHTWMAPTFAELSRTAPGRELFAMLLSEAALARAEVLNRHLVRLLLTAWKWLPRTSSRFVALDGTIGYCLSVQALHRVFVERAERFALGPRLELEDRTPGWSGLEYSDRPNAIRDRTA